MKDIDKINLIKEFLINNNCKDINFFEENRYYINSKNYLDLYNINFINTRNQKISLNIKINNSKSIYRASNNLTVSWYRSVINNSQNEINNFIREYRKNNNNKDMHKTKFPMQQYPIMFLNSLNNKKELNYYIELFLYDNIVAQNNRANNYIFMDSFKNFIDYYLPVLV